ncbi:MAG: PQQ-dependent sugar dehydrogenase [Bacteroidetes bacterium]|nr:MAG: PQQ-dependent sugar dehydrogenase [Bacteroidota bacterium]
MNNKIAAWVVLIFAFVALTGCQKDKQASAPTGPVPLTGTPQINIKTVVSNAGIIWGFDFLPDGRMLLTQKSGQMQLLDTATGSLTAVSGLPTNINPAGQGGLLDVLVAPDFATSRRVYITFSITGNFLTLGHFRLDATTATNWTALHTTATPSQYAGHYGSRLAMGADAKLYWAVGEGGVVSQGGASSPNQNGQLLNTLWGKVHRINPDGSVPADNPVFDGTGRSTIFSYGHRNVQGMAFMPGTTRLYATEHGPSGGCELNLIEAGRNFGWPLFSNGVNYNGSNISNGHSGAGITAPLVTWTPALAPSGLSFINHPSYRNWNGNLLTGSLSRRHLLMINFSNGQPGAETILLPNTGRVRQVKQGPLGIIYVSVEDGRLLALTAR